MRSAAWRFNIGVAQQLINNDQFSFDGLELRSGRRNLLWSPSRAIPECFG